MNSYGLGTRIRSRYNPNLRGWFAGEWEFEERIYITVEVIKGVAESVRHDGMWRGLLKVDSDYLPKVKRKRNLSERYTFLSKEDTYAVHGKNSSSFSKNDYAFVRPRTKGSVNIGDKWIKPVLRRAKVKRK